MKLFQTVCLLALVSPFVLQSTVNAQDTSRRDVQRVSGGRYLLQQDEDSDLKGSFESNADVLASINPLRKPMSSLSVDIREFSSEAPSDRSNALTESRGDNWTTFAPSPIGYAWAAPDIRYQPLFFENVRLERYGQTRGPWREVGASGLHYFSSLALLPYHMYHDHIYECDYPLGFCRPGNPVSCRRQLQFWGW